MFQPPTILATPVSLVDYVRDHLLAATNRLAAPTILRTHRMLLDVLALPSTPYVVRRQGSAGERGLRALTRRIPGIERPIVFTDNSPPIWLFHACRRLDVTRSQATVALATEIAAKRVPMAHLLRPNERDASPDWPLLGKVMKTSPELWSAKWKLSHILPCSPQPGEPNDMLAALEKRDLDRFFRIRTLRNLSPFNYFISPMPTRFKMTLDGRMPHRGDLGEAPQVINVVIRLLHDEVFANLPEVQAAFREFLREAGDADLPSPESLRTALAVTVEPKTPEKTRQALRARPVRVKPEKDSPVVIVNGARIFQVGQTALREQFSSILVAPDGSRGGWNLLREVEPGDVILHKSDRQIVALSVIEMVDEKDSRLDAYRSVMREVEVLGPTALRYSGTHLTLRGHDSGRHLVSFCRSLADGLRIPSAVPGYGGYMVAVREKHIRPDLQALIDRYAGAPSDDEDSDEAA